MNTGEVADVAGCFWRNRIEALSVLNPLVEHTAPSKEALVQLSSIPPLNTNVHAHVDPQVACAFLKAASKHMPAAADTVVGSLHHYSFKQLLEVVSEMAGKAAVFCKPRSIISSTGILSAFANFYDRSISILSVEFIQCALLGAHYRFAARIIGDDWPLPGKGVSFELVLRYFYLRGLLHLGCDNLKLAIRCFWTVLSIPSDVASVVAVDSLKKMILANCILMGNSVPYVDLVATPAGLSYSVARFLHKPSSSSTSEESDVHISAYLDLAKAFHAGSRQAFASVCSLSSHVFDADGNAGLVARLSREIQQLQLVDLAMVFKVLPISKLATELGCSEHVTIDVLKKAIGIEFKITGNIVEFDASYDSGVTTDHTLLMKLSEFVRKVDVSTTKSSRYQVIKESARPPRGVDDF